MCKLTWDTVYQQAAFNAWGARRVSSSSINKRVGGSSRAGVGRTWRESTSDVFDGISELRQARRGKRDAGTTAQRRRNQVGVITASPQGSAAPADVRFRHQTTRKCACSSFHCFPTPREFCFARSVRANAQRHPVLRVRARAPLLPPIVRLTPHMSF